MKAFHEIRDPVHEFVRITERERELVRSWPIQRLRHVHQLGMSYLVYPGACHSRFEHSLGVMELAGRVFDVITREDKLDDEVRRLVPEIASAELKEHWRRVVRAAALCHDIGHPPFSHAAEKEVFPDGWDHEQMTRAILESEAMKPFLSKTPPLPVDEVVKLAVGPDKLPGVTYSNWEAILSEIIVGDVFGVDRMDYLLRDSHHAGVVYGKFDQVRLIDTLRILPSPDPDHDGEPVLGIEEGGVQSAEALLIARYFMYAQVYFHKVRIAYDLHLIDFLRCWLPGSQFPTDPNELLPLTDNEVLAAMLRAYNDKSGECHDAAARIVDRKHFKLLYKTTRHDRQNEAGIGERCAKEAADVFGPEAVRQVRKDDRGGSVAFPIRLDSGEVVSSMSEADVNRVLQPVTADYVFIAPERESEAVSWLDRWRKGNLQEEGAAHGPV